MAEKVNSELEQLVTDWNDLLMGELYNLNFLKNDEIMEFCKEQSSEEFIEIRCTIPELEIYPKKKMLFVNHVESVQGSRIFEQRDREELHFTYDQELDTEEINNIFEEINSSFRIEDAKGCKMVKLHNEKELDNLADVISSYLHDELGMEVKHYGKVFWGGLGMTVINPTFKG